MEFTKCKYEGSKVNERMESADATFIFNQTSGATYRGEMKDGMFHGRGVLTLKNNAKIAGLWDNGVLIERKYIFSDNLEFHEDVANWDYCRESNDEERQDRRFHEERSKENTIDNYSKDHSSLSLASSCGVKPAIPNEIQSNILSDGLKSRLTPPDSSTQESTEN